MRITTLNVECDTGVKRKQKYIKRIERDHLRRYLKKMKKKENRSMINEDKGVPTWLYTATDSIQIICWNGIKFMI